ncbi:MAG: HAD family hydrolase [Candidatus Methanomethylophilaceae archaeon]|jgi:HAD superfamily hydrolase (TIGR01509 family)|nr:HAD family hydrolase [Candidatus Methanomethylophilaceae archaeon]NCA73509.1 HAD family hydrolase [Gammaproteobacteria bacterium]MDD2935991.1 HAD family hydrolase [Candidatus Methanomethylophilaceae archaeon]MDD3351127.1 HAD family hydrolase [Candidatus Methanomethylophilaceae archaeon]MDD3986176.1 HAD family hydrolase [Candidatus Methanomethylophilaceae archaeon]
MHIPHRGLEGTVLRYSTYIFDFDNTLFDTRGGYEACYRKAFRIFGMAYDPSKYYQYIRTPLHAIFEKHYPGCPCKYREFVAEFMKEAENSVVDTAVPFPETAECIEKLADSGKRMAIVSGSYESYIYDILENNGLRGHFGTVIGYENSLLPKPDPYPINFCIRNLGARPSECVYIGDSPDDITAAERAGIGKILVDRHGVGGEIEADRIISDLTGLLDLDQSL